MRRNRSASSTRWLPDAELDAAAEALVARLGEKSRAGLRGAKHLANLTSDDRPAPPACVREIDFVHRYATTERDATEGLVALQGEAQAGVLALIEGTELNVCPAR